MSWAFPAIREAVASARSQPVASVVTLLMIGGMILAVMLTTGRTVGAEQRVLGSIDSAGTRMIVVRAEPQAGITADVLRRIAQVEGIEWSAAFSAATDATNTVNRDGIRVPVRYAYGPSLGRLGVPGHSSVPGQLAYASSFALQQLGMPDDAGSITLTTGPEYAVAGRLHLPDYLSAFEPLVLVPHPDTSGSEAVGLLIVIASRPDLVAPVSKAVLSVLAPTDPSTVSVQTSESFAQLRGLVQKQLTTFSRGLVLVMLATTGALVAVILYGLVMMRRKDFGRRRALGATRSLIIGLVLAQTALLAIGGVLLGLIVALGVLGFTGEPLPGVAFPVATGLLAVATAVMAAIVPAIVASRREPIRELRVP